jgi:hypothetical protein
VRVPWRGVPIHGTTHKAVPDRPPFRYDDEMVTGADAVAIHIALDPDPITLAATIPCSPAPACWQPVISLIQCYALARHLQCVLGAAGRTISRHWLRDVRVLIVGRANCSDGHQSVTLTTQPTAELFKMQTRLTKAIAPGIVEFTTSKESTTGTIPQAPFCVLPELEVQPFAPFAVRLVSASVYKLEKVGNNGSLQNRGSPGRLLWRLSAEQ